MSLLKRLFRMIVKNDVPPEAYTKSVNDFLAKARTILDRWKYLSEQDQAMRVTVATSSLLAIKRGQPVKDNDFIEDVSAVLVAMPKESWTPEYCDNESTLGGLAIYWVCRREMYPFLYFLNEYVNCPHSVDSPDVRTTLRQRIDRCIDDWIEDSQLDSCVTEKLRHATTKIV